MRTLTGLASLLAAGLLTAGAGTADDHLGYSAYHDYRVVTVAEGFIRPWSLAFLPNGDLLVTEKPGRLRIVRNGTLEEAPIEGLPPVFAEGQGGLLDVVPHPDFTANRMIYLSYAKPLADGASTTAVIRGRLEGNTLSGVEEVFVADSQGRGHYGSRLAFDGQGHLFITIGDRQVPPEGDLEAHPAQDITNHHGVVVRINEDGTIPGDNPFVGQADAEASIWTYGHRNAQGLVVDPRNGDVWITEHGPQGGDELNLIKPGEDYGWPVVGYGVNYRTGSAIHGGTLEEGTEQPLKVWVPSTGVSGLALYQGDAFPHWQGALLAGGLSGQRVSLLHLDGQQVIAEETLVQGIGRVRDVREGPDGFIYLAIDDRSGEPSSVVRLEPVERAPVPPKS